MDYVKVDYDAETPNIENIFVIPEVGMEVIIETSDIKEENNYYEELYDIKLEEKIEDVEITEHLIFDDGVNEMKYNIKSECDESIDCSDQNGENTNEGNVPQQDLESGQSHFNCDLCSYVSNREVGLRRHKERIHSKSKRHRRFFDSEPEEEDVTKIHKKTILGKSKKQKSGRNNKTCSNAKDYKCYSCEFFSHRKENLRNHIESIHLNLRQHRCHMCEYTSNWSGDLKRHIDFVHLNKTGHKCHLCDYVGRKKYRLKRHIDSVHLKMKPLICDFCDYATNIKTYLQHHIESTHFNIKKHSCHLCEFVTNWKSVLKRHIASSHFKEKPHKCHLCDFSSNRRENLKTHIDTMHFNLRRHKCNICGFTTNVLVYLKEHINYVHLNLKRFKCDLCNYASNRKKMLKDHVNLVHSE